MRKMEHDVLVIGSGAGGGMTAYVLAKAGVKVMMLEAGRDYNPALETPMFNLNRDAPLLGSDTPDKDLGYYRSNIGGWTIEGEPYGRVEGSRFRWFRTRMLGGRTNHWGRNSFRMGPYDFKPKARDGLGVDWPISYEDMREYYDRTEALIGVCGVNSGLENHPDSAPGILHPPPKMRIPELYLGAAAASMDIPIVPARRAILTRPTNDGRSPCFWASNCGRGCSIGAAFQTTTSLIPWAQKTGNLSVLTNAMVYEVTVDKKGNANGVRYIDKTSGEHKFMAARAVVLAASAGESARILLNSNGNSRDGLANTSGQVGRNLLDSVGGVVSAQVPDLENRPRYNEEGNTGFHAYVPFWLYKEQARGELDFPRDYHIEIYSRFDEPGLGLGGVTEMLDGYGREVKEDARRYYGSFIHFNITGAKVPNAKCYAELDPDLKDKFGIPALKFSYQHSDEDLRLAAHARQVSLALIDKMGGQILGKRDVKSENSIRDGGATIHEVGTVRMGSDPATSPLNSFGQSWDVSNLYVTDGSVFSSESHKNPTLTIMALAWRSADHLIDSMKKGDL